jgi:hypothetical protein
MDISGEETHRLCLLFAPPPYVKSASATQRCGNEGMEASLFANPRQRQYPCHTPAATWLSAAFYYNSKEAAAPQVERVIHDAATFFRILPDIERLKTAAQAEAPQLTDDDYGLIYEVDGDTRRAYPLRNALEVKAAAAWLQQHRDALRFVDRHTIATKILKKADQFGASLGEHATIIDRMAGDGCCSAKEAAVLLMTRAHLLAGRDQAAAQELKKTAEAIRQEPRVTRDPGLLLKLATAVDDLDKKFGITDYSDLLPRVEDALFSVTVKEASSVVNDYIQLPTGEIYDRNDVAQLRTEDIRNYCGSALADRLNDDGFHISAEKAASVLPQLPREDAAILSTLLADRGVQPAYRDKAASPKLTPDDLRFLAAQPVG